MRWTLSVMLLSALTLNTVTLTAQVTPVAQGPNLYSRQKEEALGAQLAQQVRRSAAPLDSSAALGYVQRLGDKLAAQLPEPRFPFTFALTASDQSNVLHEPLSLPGGYIFVPASLFLAAQDEAEFAGMLAHAMAHVADRDGTRGASRGVLGQMSTIPLIFYGGWTGYGARQASATAIPVAFVQFERQYEQDADLLAVKLTAAAGYDPQALVRYFTRVWPDDAKDSNLRDARIAAMRTAIQQLAPVPATDEFHTIQEQSRGLPK
jgi:predicted Zn-dependent protease